MEAVGVQELFRLEIRAHFRDTHFRACAGPSVRVSSPGRKPSAFLADMGDMGDVDVDVDMGTWRIGACDVARAAHARRSSSRPARRVMARQVHTRSVRHIGRCEPASDSANKGQGSRT